MAMQRKEEPRNSVVEVSRAPSWKKQFLPGKNYIMLIAPTGEEISNKKKLKQYLKSHPGDVTISDIKWSNMKWSNIEWRTSGTLRRSSRISEKGKETPAQEEPPTKRARSKKMEQDEAEKSEGVKETETKDGEMSDKEHPEIESEVKERELEWSKYEVSNETEDKEMDATENVPGDATVTKKGQSDGEDGKIVQDQSDGNVPTKDMGVRVDPSYGHNELSSERPNQQTHFRIPPLPASPSPLAQSYFDRGVPSGPYYEAPGPTGFLTDAFRGWTGIAERVSIPTHDLTEGARLMNESYHHFAYCARQTVADLTYMRTTNSSGGGSTDQLKHDNARAIEAHQASEEALTICKASLKKAQTLILSGQKRLEEEISTGNQLRRELEEAEGKLSNSTYLAKAVMGSPTFTVLENNAMRQGVIWTIKMIRAKYPNLPPKIFMPLYDAFCATMRPTPTPTIIPSSSIHCHSTPPMHAGG